MLDNMALAALDRIQAQMDTLDPDNFVMDWFAMDQLIDEADAIRNDESNYI